MYISTRPYAYTFTSQQSVLTSLLIYTSPIHVPLYSHIPSHLCTSVLKETRIWSSHWFFSNTQHCLSVSILMCKCFSNGTRLILVATGPSKKTRVALHLWGLSTFLESQHRCVVVLWINKERKKKKEKKIGHPTTHRGLLLLDDSKLGQSLGFNRVLTTRLLQWLSWVFATEERKKAYCQLGGKSKLPTRRLRPSRRDVTRPQDKIWQSSLIYQGVYWRSV